MSQLGTKKSRKGCVRCKQRRVKCDEEAPCSNCVRRNEECSLLEPTPSGSETTTTDPAIPANADEWIQDLELMHHYSTSATLETLGIRARAQEIWRDYIPKQAIKHKFLMHGILALSALHLAYLNKHDPTQYLQLCDKHQTIALKKFRTMLSSEIEPEVADAIFALASTISVSSMARACATVDAMDGPKAMSMEDVAEHIFLTRGIRDVIDVTHDYIRKGPMSEIFDSHRMPEGTEITLPDEVSDQFNAVYNMLESWGLDTEALTHCQSALAHVDDIYRNITYWASLGNVETGQVWRWKTMVTTGFVRLIQARCQPALIVFAYYAAATSAVRTAWYNENWGEYAIRGVSLELDATMLPWIKWPTQQVNERMAVLGVRVSSSPLLKPLIGFGSEMES